MPEVLLKRWNDWSAGVGHLIDDGRTPGMYSASGILGLRGELRPAPLFNTFTGAEGLGTATLSWTLSGAGDAAFVAAVVEPVSSTAAVTYDAKSTGKADAASLTFAHTCTGSNLALFVGVSVDDSVPTGVTYDGAAMTKIADEDGDTTGNASLWVKVGPSTGANNVVVTCGAQDEIVGGAVSFTNVSQTAPVGDYDSDTRAAGTTPTLTIMGQTSGLAIGVIKTENVTATAGQTERWNDIQDTDVRGAGQTTTIAVGNVTPRYFLEEPYASDPTQPYLYIMSGWDDGSVGKLLHKVSLANADFATLMAGVHKVPTGYPGQPAKYRTDWYLPSGLNYKPSKLDAVGDGDTSVDTFTVGTVTMATGSADHYANLNSQLVAVVLGGGAYILSVGGAPATAADWGSAFQVGDYNTRSTALRSVKGASIILKSDGLFSFDRKARSRLIFEDFNVTTTMRQIAMVPWFSGLVIGAPQGLFYYVPGERPIKIDFSAQMRTGSPPPGVTELGLGRFLGVATHGAYLYTIYQPDPTSTSALVLYTETQVDPQEASFTWNVLGTITLASASVFAGIHIADSGYPTSTAEKAPSLWFSNVGDPRYIVLNPAGGPIRTRTDTHKVTTSGSAHMSELFFSEPMDLTRLVVHTSADMASGDEWQISLIPDGTGKDEKVGAPFKGSGTRHERKLGRHSVSRLVLKATWTGTSSSARVPPPITRIELYGNPEREMARAS